MGARAELTRARGDWLEQDERGSSAWIGMTLWVCRRFGPLGARAFVYPALLYFLVSGGRAARASRDYLRRMFGRATWLMVLRHFRTFVDVTIDRVFLIWGEFDRYTFDRNGTHNLERLKRERTGAVLLGAHLGSFEAMRAMSRSSEFPLNIVVHHQNARRINEFLRALDPTLMKRVIEIDPTDPSFVLRIQERSWGRWDRSR